MAKKTRTQHSVRNVMVGTGGYFFNLILSFVCRIMFTHVFNSVYLGVSSLFSNIFTMLSLAELGIGTAIIYALYKPIAENDKEKIASIVLLYKRAYRTVGLVVTVAGIAVMPFLHLIVGDSYTIPENMYVVYLMYLISTTSSYLFFSYKASLITAMQENWIVTGLGYIQGFVQNALQIISLAIFKNFYIYLAIQIASIIAYNFVISIIADKKYPYIKKAEPLPKEERSKIFKNLRYLIVYKLSGVLVHGTDNVITSYFKGLSTVGLSTNYTLLSTMCSSFINQIFTNLTASVGNLNASESIEKKFSVFKTINFANFWFYSWFGICIFVLGDDIVHLMFGASYVMEKSISFIIAINFFMAGMQQAVWTFRNTMGLFKYGRYMQCGTAAINLVVSIILGKYWGLFGILLATAIARACTNTWYDPYALFKHGFKMKPSKYFIKYFIYVALLFSIGAATFFACKYIDFKYLIVTLVVKGLICIVLPNLIIVLIYRKSNELQSLLAVVKSMKIVKKFHIDKILEKI